MRTIILCALHAEFTPPDNWRDFTRYSGMGKVNAAIAAGKACQDLQNLGGGQIINVGTAGGCGYNLGELVECGSFFQRDVANLAFGGVVRIRPGLTCATGDTFETRLRTDCDVVDMEAYAIARACIAYGIKFRCFKYISDIVGSNSIREWEDNIGGGQELFVEKLEEIL